MVCHVVVRQIPVTFLLRKKIQNRQYIICVQIIWKSKLARVTHLTWALLCLHFGFCSWYNLYFTFKFKFALLRASLQISMNAQQTNITVIRTRIAPISTERSTAPVTMDFVEMVSRVQVSDQSQQPIVFRYECRHFFEVDGSLIFRQVLSCYTSMTSSAPEFE